MESYLEQMRNQLGENNYPPDFDPEKWEECLAATCYSYALDFRIDVGILIGDLIESRVRKSDSIAEQLDILMEELREADLCVDFCDTLDLVEEGFLKIYIEWNDAGEYHFYRQDSDGRWSHKSAGNLPTQYDNQGFLIYDPEEIADHGRCFIISRF